MDLKELLNKNDYNKLRVIETLMNAKSPLPKKELAKKIGVSNFLLDSYLTDIESIAQDDRFGITFARTIEKNIEFFCLKKSDRSNLRFILFHFFEQSIDYQLLTILQQKPGCSVAFLTDRFFLSESVLYAHFQHINEFLEIYGIQIKKGRLIGSMLDVYYFFYYFYWFTLPLREMKKRFYHQEMDQLLQFLEQKIAITIPGNVKMQFYLWSALFFQQNQKDLYQSVFSPDVLQKLDNDKLYQTIRQAYFTMNSATAFPGNEDFPIYMYIFFTSIYILPTRAIPSSKIGGVIGNYEPFDVVIQMQQIVKKQLAKLHINLIELPYDIAGEIYYLLAQAHHQLFYFKRYISTLNTEFFLSTYPFNHRLPKVMHQNACAMTKEIETFLDIHFDQHTFESIRYIYLTILKKAERFSKDKLTIGIFCHASYLRRSLLVQQAHELFSQRYNAVSTVADPTQKYDLLVADTSYFLEDFTYHDFYILSGEPTLFDLNKITEKLDTIYKRKKQCE